MPGTDYDLAINVHICRNGVSGMSPACENQALQINIFISRQESVGFENSSRLWNDP